MDIGMDMEKHKKQELDLTQFGTKAWPPLLLLLHSMLLVCFVLDYCVCLPLLLTSVCFHCHHSNHTITP